MELSKGTALTEIARDPTSRANLVAIGLVLLTTGVIVASIISLSIGGGLTATQIASLTFTSRVLVAVGALFISLALLVPAVSDASLGTAVRIAFLVGGVLVLIVLL